MSDDPTATPEEETQVYKDVCQNLVPYVLLGRGDRQLETLMYDYVHADRRAVKNDQTKLVTFARDNVVQAENDVKVQKKIIADYQISELNSKRELQDKERELHEIGKQHHTQWDRLSEHHEQIDQELQEQMRNLMEARNKQN